jgi:hypothetical protein
LQELCNLGYARTCCRLPEERAWDAVRFSVASATEQEIRLLYVCELEHRPGQHGTLEYDVVGRFWPGPHSDARIQKMAESYVDAYLSRRG